MDDPAPSTTLDLGDLTITRVVDWTGPVSTVDVLLPELDRHDWETERDLVAPDFWDPRTDAFQLALQSWVIRSGGRTIVVDTSVGHRRQRPNMPDFDMMDSRYPDALLAVGVRPDEVDVVVNTHLHVDHVGWNTRLDDGEWRPTFPNATYLLPQPDLEFWHPDAPTPPANAAVNVNVWQECIEPVIRAGQVTAWTDTYRIDEHLQLELAPGHTPGSSMVTATGSGTSAVLVGDVLHSPIQVAHPHANSCFCEDPQQARVTRSRILSRAADTNSVILPGHLPGHGAFEVARDGDRFALRRWAAFDAPVVDPERSDADPRS